MSRELGDDSQPASATAAAPDNQRTRTHPRPRPALAPTRAAPPPSRARIRRPPDTCALIPRRAPARPNPIHCSQTRSMPIDTSALGDIRHAYESSTDTVKAIARRFGVSDKDISAAARTHGWTPRPRGADALRLHQARRMIKAATDDGIIAPEPTAPQNNGTADTDASSQAVPGPSLTTKARRIKAGGSEGHRRLIISRLYDVIDARLAHMEARVAAAKKPTAAESERESRDLTNLIKTLEKLMELSDVLAKPAAGAADTGRAGADAALAARTLADEAEQFRREIAERLDRLRANSA